MAIFHSSHGLVLTFGILGNIVSFFVYLAPLPTFNRIWRKKSTEGFHALPYLVALFSSALWLYYAFLKSNTFLLITINSFGCLVESFYFIVFIVFAAKPIKMLTIKIFVVMNIGVFGLILVAIHFISNPSNRVVVLGWICVAVSVSVFAAPLSILRQVIRTKSVEYMPFTLSFFLTLSAVMWFAYGLFLNNICIAKVIRTKSVEYMSFTLSFFLTLSATMWFAYSLFLNNICIAIPNVVGFVLGLVQMVVYAIYKSRVVAEVHPAVIANTNDHQIIVIQEDQELHQTPIIASHKTNIINNNESVI